MPYDHPGTPAKLGFSTAQTVSLVTSERFSVCLSPVTVDPQASSDTGHACATDGVTGGVEVSPHAASVAATDPATAANTKALRIPPKHCMARV